MDIHPTARCLLDVLGASPLVLTPKNRSRIQRTFPVPREQHILWADAKLGLRQSGIAVTDCGVLICTRGTAREQSTLFYTRWVDFEPACFTRRTQGNWAMRVDCPCGERFIQACGALTSLEKAAAEPPTPVDGRHTSVESRGLAGMLTGAAAVQAERAIFTEQKARVNNPAGHGELAEEANTLLDRLAGMDARVVGRDNAYNGPDRLVNGVYIQTKYYKTASGSLMACFDERTGSYRYMRDDLPMQLEVPKDQYEGVLRGFREQIARGHVPGVKDPQAAEGIVRAGRLTYENAVNLTLPGTAESLCYDALSGAMLCGGAFVLRFAVTAWQTRCRTGSGKRALGAGMAAGLHVFGFTLLQHVCIAQFARTTLAQRLLLPAKNLVGRMDGGHVKAVVDGLRALSGESALSRSASSGQLAMILRSQLLASGVTLLLFALPSAVSWARRRISGVQAAKRMAALAASIAGGAVGTVAVGFAVSGIMGLTGGAVASIVGSALGLAGGLAGGMLAASLVTRVGNALCETDERRILRMICAVLCAMTQAHQLEEGEAQRVLARLNTVGEGKFARLVKSIHGAREQEEAIRTALRPHVDAVAAIRTPRTRRREPEKMVQGGH